jgi:hypothetical protein
VPGAGSAPLIPRTESTRGEAIRFTSEDLRREAMLEPEEVTAMLRLNELGEVPRRLPENLGSVVARERITSRCAAQRRYGEPHRKS